MCIPARRATFAFLLIPIVLVCLAGCGGSPTMQNSFCSACQFLYATTNSGQILTFPVANTGVLGTPTSVAGPANSGGLLAIAPVSINPLYLYVSDPQDSAIHVYNISQADGTLRSEEHTSELQSRLHLVCRLLLEKKKPQHSHLPMMLTDSHSLS